MLMSWWWLWAAFVLLFVLFPIGYGWGYRGWGPPYPRYIQRRRAGRATATGSSAPLDHHAWAWRGDVVWMVLLVALLWAVAAFWWR